MDVNREVNLAPSRPGACYPSYERVLIQPSISCFYALLYTAAIFGSVRMNYPFIYLALVVLNFTKVALSLSSPPSGALTVGSSGTYKTVSAAVAAASSGSTIFIYSGTYAEKVYITVSDLTIYGQTSE